MRTRGSTGTTQRAPASAHCGASDGETKRPLPRATDVVSIADGNGRTTMALRAVETAGGTLRQAVHATVVRDEGLDAEWLISTLPLPSPRWPWR